MKRAVVTLALLIGALAFILTSCPNNRDGMPGQLASAKDESVSAARSAVLALELWEQHRSTRALTCVQLSDARDEVAKAYQDIATLKAEDSVDLARQELLTAAMTTIIDRLNAANAAVRALDGSITPQKARSDLRDTSDALESRYR
jgi:hypothetical protein